MAQNLKCDFCSAPKVSKSYACEDFTPEDMPISLSVGGWAACDICAGLIDSDQFEVLAERSTRTFLASLGLPDSGQFKAEILGFMRRLHQEFNRCRLKVN